MTAMNKLSDEGLARLYHEATGQTLRERDKTLAFAFARAVEDAAAPIASAQQAGEEMVCFCPECGSLGEVPAGYQACCPDASPARIVPKRFAEICRDTFRLLVDKVDANPIGNLSAPAPTASREAWAVELIQAAVGIMTPEQVGQWDGVRAFLETSETGASPDKAEAKSAWCAVCNGNPCALDVHSASPAPARGAQEDALGEDALTDLIASHLALTYHCTRVWDAWQVGTMSADDFEPVDESDTPREIAIAILAAQPPAAAEAEWCETAKLALKALNEVHSVYNVVFVDDVRRRLKAAIAAMSASKERA